MAAAAKSPAATQGAAVRQLTAILMALLRVAVGLFACSAAFNVRLFAIKEYGRLIHEYVPGQYSPWGPRAHAGDQT